MHAAIEAKDVSAVRRLVKSGVDVNDLHFREGFALSHAVEVGGLAVVRALLQAGADPNREDVLRMCIRQNQTAIAKLLIEHGCDVNGPPLEDQDEDCYESVLMSAVRAGRVPIVKALLEAGANPNLHDPDDESALLIATLHKSNRLIKLLQGYVSDEEQKFVDERSGPAYKAMCELDEQIELAIVDGDVERMERLIVDHRRDVNDWLKPEGLYPLDVAVSCYRPTVDKEHLYVGTFRTRRKHVTSEMVNAMIRRLVEMGGRLDIGCSYPPIMITVSLIPDYQDFAEWLLDRCKNIDAESTDGGVTTLQSAVALGNVEAVRLLLARGADPNHRDRNGRSVLDGIDTFEKYHGKSPIRQILIEAGAK